MNEPFDPKPFLQSLTTEPGVYQMFNASGQVLYVGKARNLKKRVSSYFQKTTQSAKTAYLLKQVAKLEVTVTASENEALILESHLIKTLKPRYNVLLRDDKSYPYIYLSSQHDFPSLTVYRGKRQAKGKYFGPYPSAGAVRETLNLLQKIFKIRSCSDSFFRARTRPCLQYQIKRCTAPCVAYIDKASYAESVKHAELFLEGKSQTVTDALVKSMEQASAAKHYEQAVVYRDQIASLNQVQQQQAISTSQGDIDIIALAELHGVRCVQVLCVRAGRLLGGKAHFPQAPKQLMAEEVLAGFIPQYYLNPARSQQIPAEIIVNLKLSEKNWLKQFLSERRGKQVKLSSKVRSVRAQWLTMALHNAKHALASHVSQQENMFQRYEALQQAFNLANKPERIECFDVSHSSGEATVASCVVFDEHGPKKSDYRRFNIEGITKGDDYAALKQALTRRYLKAKKQEGLLPDILFIDGGKGQLHQPEDVLEELQISGVLLVGVAKGPARKPGLEQLFVSGTKKPLQLPPDHLGLHLIQQIRDEAHRFAITGHRQRRAKTRHGSPLEHIEGVGPKRRQQLLKHFGGMQALKTASVNDIAKAPGISRVLAEKIYAALR